MKLSTVLVCLALAPSVGALFFNKQLAHKRGFKGLHDHPLNHIDKVLDEAAAPKDSDSTTYFFNGAIRDHFDSAIASDPTLWSQRYYVDTTFWKGEGFPVFLYIGGEGPQSAPSSRLFMWTLAEQHGALMIALEHRFYGESRPTESMTTEELQYLSSEQALEDLVHFQAYIKAYDPTSGDGLSSPALVLPASAANSEWVTFGGSYPGNLATWIKLKYPSLLAGTVGSSAPVYAENDFYQYSQVVGQALGYETIGGSSECAAVVQNATVSIMEAFNNGVELPEGLQPCSDITTDLDMSMYQATVFGNFQGTVQYNLMGNTPYVSDVCDFLTDAVSNSSSSPLQALADMFLKYYPADGNCIESNFTQDYIEAYLSSTDFSPSGCDLDCVSDRQWIYQSCNEFGYFQTTADNPGQPTNSPFDVFSALNVENAGTQVCQQAFGLPNYSGPGANAGGLSANSHYGARHVEGINITMPNGNMDPWHALSTANETDLFYESGSSQEVSTGVSIVEIDGTAHCRDMYAPGVFESVGLEDTTAIQWAHQVIAGDVCTYLNCGM